jgi:hypothetical protein
MLELYEPIVEDIFHALQQLENDDSDKESTHSALFVAASNDSSRQHKQYNG